MTVKQIEKMLLSIEYEIEERDYWLGYADALVMVRNLLVSESESEGIGE